MDRYSTTQRVLLERDEIESAKSQEYIEEAASLAVKYLGVTEKKYKDFRGDLISYAYTLNRIIEECFPENPGSFVNNMPHFFDRYGNWQQLSMILAYTNTMQSRLGAMVREYIPISPMSHLISEKDIVEELVSLQREFGHFHIHTVQIGPSCHKFIGLITRPISIKTTDRDAIDRDIEFGEFYVYFSLDPSNKQIIAIPLQPNFARGYFHPHVGKEGNICLGDAKIPIANARGDMRFTDAFLLIRAILENYSLANPFEPLERWYMTSCKICDDFYNKAERKECSYCKMEMCPICAEDFTCSICGKIVCPRHKGVRKIMRCNTCNELMCTMHYNSPRRHACAKK